MTGRLGRPSLYAAAAAGLLGLLLGGATWARPADAQHAAARAAAPRAHVAPALQPSTRANLLHAMNTEGFAYAAYHAYADGAMQSGHRSLALLWSTIGDGEFYDHFTTEAGLVGLVGSNAANLRAAIAAEAGAIPTYTQFAKQARLKGCPTVAARFTEIAKQVSKSLARPIERDSGEKTC